MAVQIQTTVDMVELLKAAKVLPQAHAAVKQALHVVTQRMVRYLTLDRLSKQGPDTLASRTGTARRSIQFGVEDRGTSIESFFGTPLRYVRAHDQGFVGQVRVKAHTRRGFPVVAHDRMMNIRARRMFERTLREEETNISPTVVRALKILTMTGKLPSFSDLV